MKTKSRQSNFLFALTAIWCCVISMNSFGQCTMPSALNVTGVTVSEATLNWTGAPDAIGYNIQYRIVGAPSWATVTSTIESVTISSLTHSSTYEWQVQADCGSSHLSGFRGDNFTTLAITVCDMPTGLNSTGITTTSATLGWDAIPGVIGYNIQYRVAGSQTWSVLTSPSASVTVSSLTPATNYELQVQSDCGGAFQSYFSKPISFNTLPSSGCNIIPTALSAVISSGSSALLSWTGGTDDGTSYGSYSYVIQYRVAGTQTWNVTNSSVPSLTLSGLSPSASYEWMVSTDCGNSNNRSAFSTIATFSMTGSSPNASFILTVPNASNPSTRSAMFLSTGNTATDAQVVSDWLAAHGIH